MADGSWFAMRSRRRRGAAAAGVAVTVAVVLAMLAGACGGGSGGAPGQGGGPGGTFRLGIVEPTAIDPYNVQESEGTLVQKQLFDGLVKVDDNGKPIPGVATGWRASDHCRTWTFALRRGTTFSNGEPVDAAAFVRGMTRAARKAAASDVAYHMSDIAGYEQIHDGDAATFSGLSTPDPYTLRIALSTPNCEFHLKTIQGVYSPVPEAAGAASNKAYNDQPIGNGPFKMDGPWLHDQSIALVRNDRYDGVKPKLDRVEIAILPSTSAQDLEYKNLEGGQADFARIPPTLAPPAEAKYAPTGGWIRQDTNGINYLLPITATPPMNSVDARKAVSHAIDRNAIIQGVFKGFQTPADSFVPRVIADAYQPGVCDACTYDVAKAKALAAKAGLKPGTTIQFGFNTGGGHDAWVQAVAQQLKDNLGLNVQIRPMPFAELLEDEARPNATGIYRAAWSADYPTPENFLGPLLSSAALPPGDNRGRYRNPRFDAALAKGRQTEDRAARIADYKQAERIAIGQDLALIPLWYRTQVRAFDATRWSNVRLDYFENPTLQSITQK
jgi:oligopeptide transport system substrate-binding protein